MTHDTGRFIGCYGEKIATPNLDRIANEGARFNKYFSSAPVCGPSRGAMITGKFINRSGTGFQGYGPDFKDPMPQYYAKNGYHTCHFGLYDEHQKVRVLGYDSVYPDGQDQAPQGAQHRASSIMPAAADYILNYKNKKPLFLWIGLYETHRPFKFYEPDRTGENSSLYNLKDDEKTQEDLSWFRGSVKSLDEGVGVVLDAIEKSGKTNNTIVVYTTDHGIPFPDCKGTLYDGGTNISLLLRWKERINPRVCDNFLSNIDLYPTLCELCGFMPPKDIDGKSFAGCLLNGTPTEREYVFTQITTHCRFRPERAVRSKNYKYIRKFHQTPGGYMPFDVHESLSGKAIRQEFYARSYTREELYDLEKDPCEKVNVADCEEYRTIKEKLNLELINFMVSTKDPLLFGKPILSEHILWKEEKLNNGLPVALW